MPVWIEIVLNLVGYGGFVALAIYHRAPDDQPPERKSP